MSRKQLVFWLILIPDILLLYFSLWASVLVRYHNTLDLPGWRAHIVGFSVIYFFWLIIFYIHNLFDVTSLRRYTKLLFSLVSAMTINLIVAIIYFYFQPNLIFTPRRFLLINVGIAFLCVLAWHLAVKYFLKNRLVEGLYLFSFNNELNELEEEIKQHNYLGYSVLGHLNEQTISGFNFRSDAGIILPDAIDTRPEVLNSFYQLRKLGVSFYNHKSFYENLLRRVYLSQINEVWFLENIDYREKKFYNLVKRTLDILLGLLGFVFFLVSWPFCALAIKLNSRGPILFTQERIGRGGVIFKVHKYRTMDRADYKTWTDQNDLRITTVGKFLRKSRIDEWPQFINLLIGNMSLVGPRPEQPQIVQELQKQIPFYDERHLVKPGITGWAQLNNIYAGNMEETRQKLQYDLYYVKNKSFLFDLEIILKTIYYIFTWQGR